VAIAVVAAGCGSAKDARRHDLNAYVQRVNAVEDAAAVEWRRVQTAYATIGRGKLTAKKLAMLEHAPLAIDKLHAKLGAIPAPPVARKLRVSLLRLLDGDREVASELVTFVHYVTAVAPLQRDVALATKGLQATLKQKQKRAVQEATLDAFAARAGEIAQREGALTPPPALVPWAREQRDRALQLRTGAQDVRDGIAHNDRTLAARGLTELRDAAAQQSVTAADREAILAYNARVVRMRRLAAAVAREQHRLSVEYT